MKNGKASKMSSKTRRQIYAFDRPRQHQHINVRLACGKACHPTKGDARVAIRRTEGMLGPSEKPGELMAYFCERCEAWHIGHSTRFEPKHLEALTRRLSGAGGS